ncbi:glycoside hydrolase family 3 N-terminal domain-containing protein [Nocardioides sp. MAHUQ-72]|uniref:glycoside hydrolase family 3 N-terminal domain-containing protein n=1 Tax=unclassified Nocardioides TaxID=2615069 RepID=UPI003616D2E0
MSWLSIRPGSVVAVAALVTGLATGAAPAVVEPAEAVPTVQAGDAPPHVPGTLLRRVDPAEQALARMTLAQRVGQLFMVGTPASAASPLTRAQIDRFHVGNVMLTGRSRSGTRAPARVVAALQERADRGATGGVRLLVATDQEGGQVQVLAGRGISQMPSALEQGRWTPGRLRSRAADWAGQLRASGVTMNLAAVADTVPGPRAAALNPPIGAFDRAFGYTPRVVTSHAVAFARGMSARGVVPTVKHFPGLGRVHANTDLRTRVTDRVTRRHDPYLAPFRSAVRAGVPVVMMSTAYYARLDPHRPAAFSPFVIGRMLRGDLGFRGVVVSDDLGSARQVASWTAGQRAVRFVRAGGDLVLTVDPGTLPSMYDAVLRLARSDRDFRERVERSALRVLEVKADQHLLGG